MAVNMELKGLNIIIIEDEKPAARLLQRKVEKLGLQVEYAFTFC
jgi:two-component system response regulator LytT